MWRFLNYLFLGLTKLAVLEVRFFFRRIGSISKIIFYSLIMNILFFKLNISKAEAWLIKKGQYEIHHSYLWIDKKSRKKVNMLQEIVRKADKYMAKLQQESASNLNNSASASQLSNKDRTLILAAKKQSDEADFIKSMSDRPILKNENKTSILFGANDDINIGLSILDTHNAGGKYNDGKSMELYFKYSLYNKGDVVLTLKPLVNYDNYFNKQKKFNIGSSILFGIGKNGNIFKNSFWELEISGTKCISNNCGISSSHSFSIQKGLKGFWDIEIINYLRVKSNRFSKIHLSSNKTKTEIFDKILVIKKFYFKQKELKTDSSKNFTLEFGYFWKTLLGDSFGDVSGPIISAHMNI